MKDVWWYNDMVCTARVTWHVVVVLVVPPWRNWYIGDLAALLDDNDDDNDDDDDDDDEEEEEE